MSGQQKHKVTVNGIQSHGEKTVTQVILDVVQILVEIVVLLVKVFYYIGLSIYRAIVPVPEKPVAGLKVLVTGAGHGIGKEIALLYAKEGATVITWDLNTKNNEETVKQIAKLGYPKAHAYTVDVSKREEVLKAADKVRQDVGDVSILINNAGIMPTRPLLQQSTEEIERTMNINVMAHYWTLQAFLPRMIERNEGHIVALCSVAGMLGFANLVPYCASKFAVRGMMQALFDELKENPNNNIKLTSVMPYMVDTGLCVNPVIKYESVMPLLDPKNVAQNIMHAQRTDILELTVPRYMYNTYNVVRLLPIKAGYALKSFLGSGLHADK